MTLDRIEITPFPLIMGGIITQRKTGNLTVARGNTRKVLYWSQGELVLAVSSEPEDSLGDFLVKRQLATAAQAAELHSDDPTQAIARFHQSPISEGASQSLLREWTASIVIPLFSLDEGTAAFSDEEALDVGKRIFLSTTAAMLQGIRSITNGLVIRRSLGDLKRDIAPSATSLFSIDTLPLNDAERKVAESLSEPETIEGFLKRFSADSLLAGRVVIALLSLGVFTVVETRNAASTTMDFDEMQRDLRLLASIGANDQRSLKAVALARQLQNMDFYQLIDVPRAATRSQIVPRIEEMKKQYNPATFPPPARESVSVVQRKLDDALQVLNDPVKRAEYDKIIAGGRRHEANDPSLQQKLAQRSIAQKNYERAQELALSGDYYGAIVLLKQSLEYTPQNADAWYLLGSCQEKNPNWLHDAVDSFQKALSINPNHIDTMLSLGDLYKAEGLGGRARAMFEDVLKIEPENARAKARLKQGRK